MSTLFCVGLAVGLIRFVLKYDEHPKIASTNRICDVCELVVTGPAVHPRCPSCGAPMDVRAAS